MKKMLRTLAYPHLLPNVLICLAIGLLSCGKKDTSKPNKKVDPVIQAIDKLAGGYDDIVEITGTGLGVDKSLYSATLNGKTLEIQSVSTTTIKLVIPKAVGSGTINLMYNGAPIPGGATLDFEYILSSTVTTLAGKENYGIRNGTVSEALFNTPSGVAVDEAGNIYVADGFNCMIRKITPDGKVSTLAGTGEKGHQDGPGASAVLNHPRRVTVDSHGTVYFTEYGGCMVRKISTDGIVSTIAGSGIQGYRDGDAATAQFGNPKGIAVDASGIIYVADCGNHCIRKIEPSGTVSTFAGNGQKGFVDGPATEARFDYPEGLSIDAKGNLYVADENNLVIRKITPSGEVSVYAGSGSSSLDVDGDRLSASFDYPDDVAVGQNGELFVANRYAVRKISPDGYVSTYAGNTHSISGFADGKGDKALFNGATNNGLVVDKQGVVWVADDGNNRIRRISLE